MNLVSIPVFGGKEHIEAIKNDIGPLGQMQIQYGAQHGRQRLQRYIL